MTTIRWPRRVPVTAPSDDPGPWAGGISVTHLALAQDAALPLLRILLLLGYDIGSLYLRYPGSATAWARLDLLTGAADGTDEGDPEHAGRLHGTGHPWLGVTLALPYAPLLNALDSTRSMAIPIAQLSGFEAVEVDTEADVLYVGCTGSQDPPTDVTATDDTRLLEASLALAKDAAIVDAMAYLDDLDLWTPGALNPDSGCGLLWLLDPVFWRPDLELGERTASRAARDVEKIGDNILVAVCQNPDVGGPFAVALTGVTPPPVVQETVYRDTWHFLAFALGAVGVFNGMVANNQAHQFFPQLGIWLRERGQESLLPEATIDELRHAPWFEVLVTLVERGVLTPTGILGSTVVNPEDPVVVRRTGANTVELSVWGRPAIVVTQVFDAAGNLVPAEPDDADGPDDDVSFPPLVGFTWDYLIHRDRTVAPPTLYLIAAPGFGINIPADLDPDGWTYTIIRMPDVNHVLEWGVAVDPAQLMAPQVLSPAENVPDQSVDSGRLSVMPGVQVTPRPEGVNLHYPVSDLGEDSASLVVEITLSGSALRSGAERYAYDVFYYVDTRNSHQVLPYISVWATPGVTVRVRHRGLPGDEVTCHVWRTPRLSDIPPFGQPLPFRPDDIPNYFAFAIGWEYLRSWRELDWPANRGLIRDLEVDTNELPWWVTFFADFVVGMIPLVGDVVDFAELAYAMSTGTDRWGRPVSNLDICLMTFGTLVPFVSSDLARGMGRSISGLTVGGGADVLLARLLGMNQLRTVDVVREVSKAMTWRTLSPRQRAAVIQEIRLLLQQGAAQLGPKLRGEFLDEVDVMNEAGNNLSVRTLVWYFTQWQARETAANRPSDLGTYLAGRGVRGPARVVLQALCGNERVGQQGLRARRPARALTSHPSGAHLVQRPVPAQPYLVQRMDQTWIAVRQLEVRSATVHPRILLGSTTLGPAEIIIRPPGDYESRFRALLTSLSTKPNAQAISPTEMAPIVRALVGEKSFYPDELAELWSVYTHVLEHDLRVHGIDLDVVLPMEGSGRVLAGIDTYYQSMLTGAGNELSTRAEGRTIGTILAGGHPPDMMRWGLPLPLVGRAHVLGPGPDIPLYRRNTVNQFTVDFAEVKSCGRLDRLITDRPWRNKKTGRWYLPELLRQTWSTLERVKLSGYQVTGPPGTNAMAGVTGKFFYYIDGERAFNARTKEMDPVSFDAWLHNEVAPAVSDQFSSAFDDLQFRRDNNIPDWLIITVEVVIL